MKWSFSALCSAVWRSGAIERALWEKDARSHGKHSGDSRATAAQTQTWAKGKKKTRMCMSAKLTALHLWRSSFFSVLVILVMGFLYLTSRPPSSSLNICLCLHRCSCCHLWRVNVVHNFTSHSSSGFACHSVFENIVGIQFCRSVTATAGHNFY